MDSQQLKSSLRGLYILKLLSIEKSINRDVVQPCVCHVRRR